MFFKKKKKEIKKFYLSEEAIYFLKKFVVTQMNITSPIDAETLDNIVDLATQWELDMIDPLSENGSDKTYDYPEKERNKLADKFVGEVTGQWDDEKLVPDFDDLNTRLGL